MHATAKALALLLLAGPAAAQTMAPLKHQPPDGANAGFLLTDGTALFQGNQFGDWWKLTPDSTGNYLDGTWTKAASLPSGYLPLYFASAVLPDGRVIIAGGEYINDQFAFSNECAIYDPVANSWTNVPPPKGWDFIGDSPSVVLASGQFMIGQKFTRDMAVLDAATLRFSAVSSKGKKDFNAEEGWTLLPNGNVFTFDVKKAPNSEIYDTQAAQWSTAGNTPVLLKGPPSVKEIHYGSGMVYYPPGEVGPGLLLPNGTIFAAGATPKNKSAANTAIYQPAASGPGSWTSGPSFPSGVSAGDTASALLPTGNVLILGSDNVLYEFNGSTLVATKFTAQTYSTIFMLPSGEAIVGGTALYQAAGAVNPAWAPAITAYPASVTRGQTYPISGQQFNGLSQAAAFGDEVETATNYPLVRITNAATGHVFYARTHGHSTMAVATGAAMVSTNFDVPADVETGAATLVVVANGIASAPVNISVN